MKPNEARSEFLLNAIHYTYETIRFLETKAGVLVATETLLLAFAIACLTEPGRHDFIMRLHQTDFIVYIIVLAGCFLIYVSALLFLVFRTIQIFLPIKDLDEKINLDCHKPKKLFYLDDLDNNKKLAWLFKEHETVLSQMSKTEIKQEYIYELRKLSYIRKMKSARVTQTLAWLPFVIVGAVILGVMVLVGELIVN